MSDAAAVAPAAAPKSRKVAVIVAIVAAVVGSGAGAFIIGPTVARRATVEAPKDTAVAGDRPIHLMENIVLNPAGTGGTRFLMLSIAIETGSTADNDKMNKRDSELRDVVLRIIGSRTIDELAALTAREPIKKEIIDSVNAMFGPKAARTVYFPQFVIQ